MKLIAIDGACRRNGKPDCTAAGGVFYFDVDEVTKCCGVQSAYEYNSTNQRGELLALLKALDLALQFDDECVAVITDSEYLFNSMTKHWYANWHSKGWVTASGDPVKNKDIWLEVKILVDKCEAKGTELLFYHIKGHCIPFGRVTADNLLVRDPTGWLLMGAAYDKFDACKSTKAAVFKAAQDLSERNNGFKLDDDVFKMFVVMNVVADAVATHVVDKADSSRKV